MVYKILLFFFCFLTLKTTAEKHTVYVSVCEVYNTKNRLVFSFRIFKNDLYDALKIKNTKSEEEKTLEITKYIKNSFLVQLDGKDKVLTLEKFVYEGDDYTETINIKLSAPFSLKTKEIYIKNTILFDFLDEQMNVVSFNVNETKETLTYKKNLTERWLKI